MMNTAHSAGHTDIGKCIQDTGIMTLHTYLVCACYLSELMFLSQIQCISDKTERDRNMYWVMLMDIAYIGRIKQTLPGVHKMVGV